MTLHHRFHRKTFWFLSGSFFLTLVALFLFPGFLERANAEPELGEVGYRGPSFGSTYAPTAAEMQSKLWFNDGIWWGSLYNVDSEQYEIFRYEPATRTWNTTGTPIDARKASRADCLWDGEYLHIASAARLDTVIADKGIRILRYRYDPGMKRYTLDSGYPILIASQNTYGIVIERDTTGELWVTYTSPNGSGGGDVYISHSNVEGNQWEIPFILPVAGASDLLSEDISSLVAFSGQIGVMWSNQNLHAMYFARHQDGAPDNQWQVSTPLQGTLLSDNHIHLKSMQSDTSGRVYVAVKTSLNEQSNVDPNAPLLVLLRLNPDGSWTLRTFGRVSERHTRPLLLLDEEHQTLYLFATSFCCGSGKIYYKELSLTDENAQFPPGLGNPFLDFGEGSDINNVTSTKQAVNSTSDILVLAGDSIGGTYVHNSIDLLPFSPPVVDPPEKTVSTRLMIPFILKSSPKTR